MKKNSFFKKIIFIAIAIGTITSGIFVVRAVNNRGNAPVAWWKMDEGQGQTTYDASGNGNNGTLGASTSDTTPDPTWKNEESCKNGKCLQFDGSNDYVSSGNLSFNIYGTNPFSLSAWVRVGSKPASGKYFDPIMMTETGQGDSTFDKAIQINSSGNAILYFWDGAANRTIGTNDITDNKWHYIVGVYGGAVTYLYVDGVLQKTGSSVSGSYQFTTPQLVLSFSVGTTELYYPGFIDDTRIYNYARSAAQIKADYNKSAGGKGAGVKVGSSQEEQNASDGLVGYWKMDEASWAGAAGEVVDSSGAGNNGVAVGGASTTSPAKFGRAGNFDGGDDYVKSVSTVNLLGSSNDITISMWVKPGGSQKQYADLFDANHGASCNFVIQQNSTDLNLFGFGYRKGDNSGWSNAGDKTTQLATNVWQHFVIIKSGTNIDHYLNGVKNGATFTVSDDGTIYKVATYWKIGDWVAGDTGRAFNGLIDDVRIYNRALSPAEIRYQY